MASSEKKIKVPLKPEEVTKEWLLESMRTSLKREDVEVTKLEAVEKNDGYLSSVFKAEVKLLNEDKRLPLFIKISVSKENPFYVFQTLFDVDVKEVGAYKDNLPLLINFEKNNTGRSVLEQNIPKVYAAELHLNKEADERGFCIIMEDISTNHVMVKAKDGLSLKQLQLSLKFLGRFHAVSYAYSTINKKPWPKEFEYPIDQLQNDPSMEAVVQGGFTAAIEDFKKMENGQLLAEKMAGLHARGHKNAFNSVFEFDERFLIHGDYWSNNVMFNMASDAIKVFDWQFFASAHPMLDYIVIAFMSNSPDNMEAWLEDMYTAYMDSITETCQDFKIPLPFTKEEFVKRCEDKGFFCLTGFLMFFFDVIKEQNIQDRAVWIGNKALKHSPELFEL